MTKEEAIQIIDSLDPAVMIKTTASNKQIREAIDMAVGALSQPSLPSNLDGAANTFNREDAARMWDYEGKTEGEIVEAAFKAGAEWMAEQSFPRWRNIDEEKPKQGEDCACISVTVNGHIKYSNFGEGPWSWDDKVDSDWLGTTEAFVGYDFYGDKEYHTCSYWMPWDEFWGSLERQFKNSGME